MRYEIVGSRAQAPKGVSWYLEWLPNVAMLTSESSFRRFRSGEAKGVLDGVPVAVKGE